MIKNFIIIFLLTVIAVGNFLYYKDNQKNKTSTFPYKITFSSLNGVEYFYSTNATISGNMVCFNDGVTGKFTCIPLLCTKIEEIK